MTGNTPSSKNPQDSPANASEALDELTGMLDAVEPCLTTSELQRLSSIEQVLREAIDDA